MKQKDLMQNSDEQRLVRLCMAGNRNAQVELYKVHYKAAFNTALRIVNNVPEAEDIMQESFITAFRKLDQFSGTTAFGAWLRRIVVNNALDSIAHRVDYKKLEEEALQVAEPDVRDEFFLHWCVDEIRKQVMELPDEQRIVLSLFLFEGFDHQEIAQILEINHNAARTRYSRAKNRLVNKLREISAFNVIGNN